MEDGRAENVRGCQGRGIILILIVILIVEIYCLKFVRAKDAKKTYPVFLV
jgi:hypothetical protein